MAVQGEHHQFVAIASKLNAGDVFVVGRNLNLTSHTTLDVKRMDCHFRVLLTCKRVLVTVDRTIKTCDVI